MSVFEMSPFDVALAAAVVLICHVVWRDLEW